MKVGDGGQVTAGMRMRDLMWTINLIGVCDARKIPYTTYVTKLVFDFSKQLTGAKVKLLIRQVRS